MSEKDFIKKWCEDRGYTFDNTMMWHLNEIEMMIKSFHQQQVKSVDLANVGGNEVALLDDDDVNTDSALKMGRTLDMNKQ